MCCVCVSVSVCWGECASTEGEREGEKQREMVGGI